MEPKQLDQKDEIVALKAQIAALEQQVKSGHEILKWGMGMFITFAVVFAGFNWWTGKSNYDRDKDSLKTEAELLERKLTMNQKESDTSRIREFTDFKTEMQRLDLDRNFQYQNTVTNLAGIVSKLFNEQAGKINIQQTNSQAQLDAQMNVIKQTLEQAFASQAQSLSNSLSLSVHRNEGLALMAMGEAYYQSARYDTSSEVDPKLGNAIPLLIDGAIQLNGGGDGTAFLPQCIFTINNCADYVTGYKKKIKPLLQKTDALSKLDELIKALEQNNNLYSTFAQRARTKLADYAQKEK